MKRVAMLGFLASLTIIGAFSGAILLVPTKAEGAPDTVSVVWRNVGPGGGGWIQSLACDPNDPNTLYLGSDVGGFYISTDGGRHFEIRNNGLTDYFVEAIAVHPQNSRTILLGTQGGIHRTTDGGKHWQRIDDGFPPPQRYRYASPIGALCIDPQRPNIVYAGIGRPRNAREGQTGEGQGAVYRSEDGGLTWRRIDGGQLPPDAVVSDIEVKPDNSRTILVATNKGIFRSDDGGQTWRPSNEGLPHLFVQELAFAPSQPNRVYATLLTTAREGQPFNGGVFRSDDAGRTWRPCNNGLPQRVGQDLYRQSNYGEIVVDPTNADVVYVGGRSWWDPGVFKTTNGGASWEWVTPYDYDRKKWLTILDYGWITFWGPAVECLALSPADPKRLYFGTSGHLFASEGGGRTWQQRYCQVLADGRFRGNGLEVTCVNDIVADPVRPQRLYFCYADIGLLISDDGGKTFRRSYKGMKGEGNCFTVVVDPRAPQTLWAATGQWAWNEGYLCRSEDGGNTWRVVGNGLFNGQIRRLVLDLSSPVRKRRLLAAVNGFGFFESRDGGENWQSINGNLPSDAIKQPRGILIDPNEPRHLLVACAGTPERGGGIYESLDDGKTWRRVNRMAPFADIQMLVADPQNFPTLYLAAREFYDHAAQRLYLGGVFKSQDGGETWERLLDFHFVSAIVVHPKNPQILFAATTDHPYHDHCIGEGVLVSKDGGKTWRKENTGLTHLNISCLRLHPRNPSVLLAGTGGNGAFIGKMVGSR